MIFTGLIKNYKKVIAFVMASGIAFTTSLQSVAASCVNAASNRNTELNLDDSVQYSLLSHENNGYSFTYQENSSWNNYVSAEITVSNDTAYDKAVWKLVLVYDGIIDNIWNADIVDVCSNTDGSYTYYISSKVYNENVPAGGSVSFGFTSYGLSDKPSEPTDIYFWDETIPEEETDIDGTDYKVQDKWNALEYAAFSSDAGGFSLYVNRADINGSIHTNGDFRFSGSVINLDGCLEALKNVNIYTSVPDGQNITSIKQQAEEIEMPDLFPEIVKSVESDASYDKWLVFSGDKTYGAEEIKLDKNIFVDGNLALDGSRVSTKGIIAASGGITYNVASADNYEQIAINGDVSSDNASDQFATSGDASSGNSSDQIATSGDTSADNDKDEADTVNTPPFIASETGDITLNGGDINLSAVLYAPAGTVYVNANKFHLEGRIIAKKIVINGTLIEINSGNHDFDSIGDIEILEHEIFIKMILISK